MRAHEANRDLAPVIKIVKHGDSVILTEQGIPFGLIEPIREASKAEGQVIRQLIDRGLLEPVRQTGPVREWKWKSSRSKAA